MNIFNQIYARNIKAIKEWICDKNTDKDVAEHGCTPLHEALWYDKKVGLCILAG